MEELRFMVCMRTDEVEEPIPGSTTTACVECGADVWQAPGSKKFSAEMKAMPLCSQCAIDMTKKHDATVHEFGSAGGTIAGEAAPQIEELINELRGAATRYEGLGIPEWMRPPEEGVDTFEELKVTATRAARHMTKPDDNWGTIVVMEGWDGTVFPPVSLGDLMAMGVPKQVLAEQLLPGMAYTANARRVVYGISSWALIGKNGEPLVPDELEGPISEHPDRQELLVLMDLTAEGVVNMSSAKIRRSKTGPPTLDEWKDVEEPASSEGLFIGAMLIALKAIKEAHAKRTSTS